MISLEKLIRVFNENFNDILSGLITTLLLAVIGTVVGLILGIFLAYGKNIKVKESDNKVIKV
jgi:ABC-type amino acid transport system permease subunit